MKNSVSLSEYTTQLGTCNVVEDFDVSDLLPWHGHVFKELEDCMWHVLQSAKVDSLVVPELAVRHIAVIADDLPNVLRGHVFLLRVHKAELALFGVSLRLQLLPLARLILQLLFRHLIR